MIQNRERPQDYTPEIYPSSQSDDVTKWRLGGDDIIENLEHHLKGEFLESEVKDTDEGPIMIQKWISRPDARFMNDTGSKAVIATATAMVNRVVFLSNISEEHVYMICGDVELALSRLIYDNWTDFEVKRRPDPIIHILMDLVFTGLMRAKGGFENNNLTKTEHIMRSYREGEGQGRKLWPFGGEPKNENQNQTGQ